MITIPECLNEWWTIKSSGLPQMHELYNFYFNEDYNWFAKVINIDFDKTIDFKMTVADADWNDTILNFEILSKSKTKQTLRFEHKNWKNLNDHFRRTSYCWAIYFQKMKGK